MSKFGWVSKTHKKCSNFHNRGGSLLKPTPESKLQPCTPIISEVIGKKEWPKLLSRPSHIKTILLQFGSKLAIQCILSGTASPSVYVWAIFQPSQDPCAKSASKQAILQFISRPSHLVYLQHNGYSKAHIPTTNVWQAEDQQRAFEEWKGQVTLASEHPASTRKYGLLWL